MENNKKQNIIYTRDLDVLVGTGKGWRALMDSLIKNLDDYNYNRTSTLFISYVKDKYGRLRCEYQGGDEYEATLIENVEDLSQYIPYDV